MPLSDAEVVAMLADMEALRVEVAHQRERLSAEQERTRALTDQVRRLDGHLDAAIERQRELHVLLLHRDEELALLRAPGRPPAIADAPRAAAASPAAAAPTRAIGAPLTWRAVLANAWDRFVSPSSSGAAGPRPVVPRAGARRGARETDEERHT